MLNAIRPSVNMSGAVASRDGLLQCKVAQEEGLLLHALM